MKLTKKLKFEIIFAILLILSLVYSVSSVTISPPLTPRVFTSESSYYHNTGANTYFATNNSLNFTQIILDKYYIEFNNTIFNITSTNTANISLSYLIPNISLTTNNSQIIELYANSYDNNVQFNLTDYLSFNNYLINRNDTQYQKTYSTSAKTYNITFNNSVWSNEYKFTIYKMSRYDVNVDTSKDVFDLSLDWANRDTFVTYDGFYDINWDTDVDVFDLSLIWAHRD